MSFLASIVSQLILLLIIAFIGRAIVSWLFVAGVRNEFLFRLNEALVVVTEPIVAPLRRFIPPLGMIDITPMVAILILIVIRRIVLAL